MNKGASVTEVNLKSAILEGNFGGVSIEKAACFLVFNTKLSLEDYRIARALGVLLVIEE